MPRRCSPGRSVEARPRPDVRGWVLLSRVRSSGESPDPFRPGITGEGKTGMGECQ